MQVHTGIGGHSPPSPCLPSFAQVQFMFEFQAESIQILTIEQVRKPIALTHCFHAGQQKPLSWLAQRQLTWSPGEVRLTSSCLSPSKLSKTIKVKESEKKGERRYVHAVPSHRKDRPPQTAQHLMGHLTAHVPHLF